LNKTTIVKSNFFKALSNDNFLSLASNLGAAIFRVLSFMLLVRSLEPNIFGEWVIFVTAGNFFEMLRFGLTRTAIIRFLSGAKNDDRKKLIGTNWVLGLMATILLAIIIWIAYFLFPTTIEGSGYSLFFIWYPILSFANLPFNLAISVLYADQKFGKILLVNLLRDGGFFIFLIINFLFFHLGIMPILYAFLTINLAVSIHSMLNKWDGYHYIFNANKQTNKTILNFGKYTTGTLIGANLLKSSDVVLLGLSPFIGTVGVALYSVPLRLTEILEIPLRSFAATAFPKMSKASIENNMDEVKRLFYSYSGALTFVILPVIIFAFIFSEQFVHVLGGPEYIVTQNIFRFFCIYGLFIAVDKFTGIALDSINQPKKNFIKVIYMALANIFGDIFMIFYLGKFIFFLSIAGIILSNYMPLFPIEIFTYELTVINILELVALVTILFTIIGIIVGLYYLNNALSLSLRRIFTDGWKFFIIIIKDIKSAIVQ